MKVVEVEPGVGQIGVLLRKSIRGDGQSGKDSEILDVQAVAIVGAALGAGHEGDHVELKSVGLDVVLVPYSARVQEIAIDELRRVWAELGLEAEFQGLAGVGAGDGVQPAQEVLVVRERRPLGARLPPAQPGKDSTG